MITCLAATLLTTLAHAGHGATDQRTLIHYLAEPGHAAAAVAAVVACIGFAIAFRHAQRHHQRAGKRR
ncbi:MAG: hypothetical protein ACODAQ_00325 [Phycisphaeraceae bacterium]